MTNFPDFHKIALLESKKNCNLEIVQYDETNMVDHTFLQPKIINSSISDSEFLHFIENDIPSYNNGKTESLDLISFSIASAVTGVSALLFSMIQSSILC